jgi:hypothetical protein
MVMRPSPKEPTLMGVPAMVEEIAMVEAAIA